MRFLCTLIVSVLCLAQGVSQQISIPARIDKINNMLPSMNGNATNVDLISRSEIVLENGGILRFITTNTRKGKAYDKSEFSILVNALDKDKLKTKKIECCNVLEFYCEDRSFDCVEYIDRTSKQLKPVPYLLMNKNWKENQHIIFNLERLIEDMQASEDSELGTFEKKSDVIQLYKNGGVYLINLKLGDKSATAILDSGASVVSISKQLEQELLKDKVISKEDYIEPAKYRIANGEILKAKRFILPSLSVGKHKMKNVMCSVVNDSSPILLGKSFLDLFTKWSINNQKQTLTLER